MATFQALIGKSFLGNFFPELRWQQLDPTQTAQLLSDFHGSGAVLTATLAYVQKHGVKFGYLPQAYSGGGWTLLHNISIAPGQNIPPRYLASLIIHEVFHLGQPILTRLSVYGELMAWQYQQQGYRQAFGKGIGEPGEAYSDTQAFWDVLAGLSAESRDDLAQARLVMKKISEHYRSDCLPLFPLFKEIWYFLRQGNFKGGFDIIKNLVTCRD